MLTANKMRQDTPVAVVSRACAIAQQILRSCPEARIPWHGVARRLLWKGDPFGGGGRWGVREIGGPHISISFHIIEVLGVP